MNEPGAFQRYNDALSRRYVIGGAGPVFAFASEGFPTVPVSDEQMDFDLRELAGIRTFGSNRSVGPTAAQYSNNVLQNPSSSGIFVVIEKMQAWSNAATTIYASGSTSVVTLATSQFGCNLDNRSGVYTGSSASRHGSYENAAAIPTSFLFAGLPVSGANVVVDFGYLCPILLKPGSNFFFWTNVVNQAVAANFKWRERVFNNNELQG